MNTRVFSKQRNVINQPASQLLIINLQKMKLEIKRDDQMKQLNNHSASSSSSSTSSYYLVFIVLAPLLIVSVIVCLFTTQTSSSLYHHPISLSTFSLSSCPLVTKQTAPNSSEEYDSRNNFTKLERLEASLSKARVNIKEAAAVLNQTSAHHDDPDYVPQGNIYRNARVFHRSYLEMEKIFKIYVYKEGEQPIFHDGPCKNIYSTEGIFIQQMEIETKYKTDDPDEAHVYFLPFSVSQMVKYLYVPDSHDANDIKKTALDYVNTISGKYPYWNRSLGADHVMLSCHDWGPLVSFHVPNLYNNSIRVLCNANTSEGFDPSRDASFPEINLQTGDTHGLIGGPPPSDRSILAFFAGHLHGDIRSILLEHWKDKDEDLRVYETVPKGVSYKDMMSKSKYCICPSGYEVASPRIVEAIYAECVPVLISDSYIPPFSDVLNWNMFSVQVPVKDIPNLKKILMEIPQDRYEELQKRVKEVQRHFVVNPSPERFDVFHMTLHSIWLRRLNIRIYD